MAAELPEYDPVGPSVLERKRFEALLHRGLNRFDESADVSAILARDEIVRGKIVADEVVREQLKRRIESMSEEVFAVHCQQLFASMPGLHLLYQPGDMSSSGLRLTLLEFLRKDAVLNQSVPDSGCDDSTVVF